MKLIKIIPFIGHRIEQHPKRWLFGAAAVVALVLVSKWLDVPMAW